MNLTKEQQAILDGEKGDVLARIMKTLIRYGELFGAEEKKPLTPPEPWDRKLIYNEEEAVKAEEKAVFSPCLPSCAHPLRLKSAQKKTHNAVDTRVIVTTSVFALYACDL